MNPGRELDALIAEKVMGWRPHTVGPEILWSHDKTRQWSVSFIHIPHYSTDIRQAWEVVEKIHERRLFVSLTTMDGGATCIIHESPVFGNGEQFANKTSDTAPHAICLAALKAVGYEKGTL